MFCPYFFVCKEHTQNKIGFSHSNTQVYATTAAFT